MSDFSDIDGGEEPLFAEYEDEDLADPPPLPPPLAILNHSERDPGALDNIGGGDDDGELGLGPSQPFDTSVNESHDQSSSAATGAKKRKPILTFNEGRLTSAKGLQAIVSDFPKVKFKGKGHERSDLNLLINNYEEWANRLFPRLAFDDFIERAEKLGTKKEVKAMVSQLRNGTTPLEDEVMLQDEEELPTVTSDTGRAGDEDHVEDDLPDDDLMLDNDDNGHDDHYGDNDDIPVNPSAEQGMVDDDHEEEETREQATNTAINDNDEDDQLSVDDQVKTTVNDDKTPSLTIGGDKFGQDNSSCHDNNDQEDIHRDTPSDHQVEEPSIDIEDTPDAVEEMFHNSVDKLFNDISVDELLDV